MTLTLKGTSQPIQQQYRLALLDLDGVVYLGKNPVQYASESIRTAQAEGLSIVYTTNNSSRMQQVVANQLKGFGLEVAPEQVVTSSVVAARMVAKYVPQGARVLVLGAEHLRQEVAKQGFQVVLQAADNPSAVIQGWYPQMTWEQLSEVSFAVEQGAAYFVTNRDLTIPREFGIAPGCGSMIQAVMNATGVEPIASGGKPESAMYDEARSVLAQSTGITVRVEECLAVGDRLDTDIEAGNRGGYDSLAVLTGVTNPHELIRAPRHLRPSYIVQDLRGLGDVMPEPQRVSQSRWICEDAEAWIENSNLRVSDTRNINALRAACSLVWSLSDEGIQSEVQVLPDFDLPEQFEVQHTTEER